MNINGMNGLRNQGGSNGPEERSFQDKVKQYWSEIPLFVRFIIIITIVLYIISWITAYVNVLMNIPGKTFLGLQLWRLFTSVFLTPSILSIIFGFMSWAPDAVRLEYTSGTVRYFLNFMINATLINFIYCVLMLLISVISKDALFMPSSGLWPLILAEITMLCLANPDNQMTFFFIPIKFPAKFYPWVLLAFFSLINMSFQFDNLVGVCYGHLFFYFLRQKLQFSDQFINKVENFKIIKLISGLSNFIFLKDTSGGFNSNQTDTNTNSNNNYVIERDAAPVTTPFKGKGTVLGGKIKI